MRSLPICISIWTSLAVSHGMAEVSRPQVVEVVVHGCGLSGEVLATAGLSTSETIAKLNELQAEPALIEGVIAARERISQLAEAIAALQAEFRSPPQDGAQSHADPEELGQQLEALHVEFEDHRAFLTTHVRAIQGLVLADALDPLVRDRLLGWSDGWGNLPLHWRFGDIAPQNLSRAAIASAELARLEASGSAWPSDLVTLVGQLESQYEVSLARTRAEGAPVLTAVMNSWSDSH